MQRNINIATRVYFDGACPLCTAEMNVLHRWDRARRLQFIDIAAPSFDEAASPVSLAALNAALHVQLPDGAWLTGMAAARHLYRVTGRGWMLAFTGWPLLSHGFDRAYAWLARHRVPVSLRLGLRRCVDGACDLLR
jgi:predicted DCC family thiol-disulfide oxidoreductase YuxK